MKQRDQSYTIELSNTPPSQRIYKDWHWTYRRRVKRRWEWKIESFGYIWSSLYLGMFAHKVTITFYFPDLRRRDKDNYVYFKGLLDGLVKAGIVRDDSEKEIDVIYPPLKLGTGERKTVIELEDIR